MFYSFIMNVFEECIRKVSMKQANLQPDLVTSDIEFWLNKHVVFGLIVAVPLVLWLVFVAFTTVGAHI